jgi:hypothetical protein
MDMTTTVNVDTETDKDKIKNGDKDITMNMVMDMNNTMDIEMDTHFGKISRIFRDAADQTLPVTEYSEIDNLI